MRHGAIHRHRQKTAIAKPVIIIIIIIIIIGLRQRRNTPPSPKNRRRAVVYVSTGLACLPRDANTRTSTAEERLYMSSLRDESPVCKYYIP